MRMETSEHQRMATKDMATIKARVNPAFAKKIRKLAVNEDRTVNDLVIEALDMLIAHRKNNRKSK